MSLRLLHAIQSANPSAGGPIEGVRQFAAVNRRFGHVTEAVTLDAGDEPWLKTGGLTVHALGDGRMSVALFRRYLEWLMEHAREYDCIIIDGIWGFHALAVRMALGRLQRRKAAASKGLRRDSAADGVIPPYVVFTHGMLDPWFKRRHPLKHVKKWLFYPWAVYPVLRDAAGVFFTCERERILARTSFWLYDCNEIVIRFGTDGISSPDRDYRSAFLAAHPALAATRNFLFLGRVHPKKGLDLLLKGVARLRAEGFWDVETTRLVIAGPDTSAYAQDLKNLAAQEGIESSVYWTGMLEGDQKWGAFQASEVFMLISHQENFGIAVVEALSARVPVLITHGVNISLEIAVDGAGLVDDDSVDGAFRLMRKWLVISPQERNAMQSQARETFLSRFTADVGAKDMLRNIYLILAARKAMSNRPAANAS